MEKITVDKPGSSRSIRRSDGKKVKEVKPSGKGGYFDTGFDTTDFVSKSRLSSAHLKETVKKQVVPKGQGQGHTSESDLSNDELDFLSNKAEEDNFSDCSAIVAKKDGGVIIRGKSHQFHPKFLPNSALKGLKFKKNKEGTISKQKQPEDSTLGTNPTETSVIKGKSRSSSKQVLEDPRLTGSSKSTRGPKLSASRSTFAEERHSSATKIINTASRRRVAPRPITSARRSSSRDDGSKEGTMSSDGETVPKPVSSRKQKLAGFPMNVSPPHSLTQSTSNFSMASSRSSFSPITQEFPMLSPPCASNTSRSRKKCTNMNDHTYSSSSEESVTRILPRLKGMGKGSSIDERELCGRDDTPNLQPFPMNFQLHGSLSLTSGPLKVDPSTRTPHDSVETQRKKTEIDMALTSMDGLDSFDNDDSVLLPHSSDPATLCPYCDEPLPSSPTAHLCQLLSSTEKKSYSDPRPSNLLGLKAPITVFIAVCQRHRFESQVLPIAEANSWPKEIDWKSLPERVQKIRPHLTALIKDAPESQNVGAAKSTRSTPSPRMGCIFWKEMMERIKEKGSRAVTGMQEQFATFENAQPGYYGELGSIVIFQTLINMFPPDSFNKASISPFSVNEFIQRILLPEVATRLIMEDQSLKGRRGMEQAVSILRESSSYGVSMFPEDSGEGRCSTRENNGAIVGDLIVMERARKRRKELEGLDELAGDYEGVDLDGSNTKSIQPELMHSAIPVQKHRKHFKSKYVKS